MKFISILTRSIAFLPAATTAFSLTNRDDITTITDQYLFSISIDQFMVYRQAKNPSTLDWTSDGCSDSPDNPLGFDFEPSCNRHGFGYANYRAQARFTEAAKDKIDSNFLSDLKNDCENESFTSICKALAEVYYAAVQAFGGSDATKREAASDELLAAYEEKMAVYNQLLEAAKEDGSISV